MFYCKNRVSLKEHAARDATMSALYRSALHARIAKLPPLDEDEGTVSKARPRQPIANFAPLSASAYFEQAIQVKVSDLDCRVYYSPPKSADGTVMVCHHGAGSSARSFALLAKQVAAFSNADCGVLAFDARGHGEHTPPLPATRSYMHHRKDHIHRARRPVHRATHFRSSQPLVDRLR